MFCVIEVIKWISFLFPLWNSSRDQHMTFVISSNAPYISFIIIATNITITHVSETYPRHCYVITISIELSCIGCQCHVAARYRLIRASHIVLQLTSSVHFIEVKRMFSISLLSSQKEWVFNALKLNTVAILKPTRLSLFVCTRQPMTHLSHFPRSDVEIWRQSDTAVMLQEVHSLFLFYI